MDRSSSIQFCHKYSNKYFYQPVVFVPGIIEIDGKWNKETKQLSKMCFENISKKSVLDLGCNIGFFVREALDAGADYAMGVDHDPVEMTVAREISSITEDKAILVESKVEDYVPDRKFDVVLMLNILHVVRNPTDLIKLYLGCSQSVIIEHTDSQRTYFPEDPIRSTDSPRCFGYRTLSFWGSDEFVPNVLR